MTIAITCAECDKDFRVKDELAGRKVKCPGCGEVVTVPGARSTAVKAAGKRPAPPQDEEEPRKRRPAPPTSRDEEEDADEEDERPRKKKKRKKKPAGNPVLLWSAVGGGVLVLLVVVLILVLDPFGSPKQTAQKPGPTPPVVPQNPPVDPNPKPINPPVAQGGVPRPVELTKQRAINNLRQVGIAFHNHIDTFRKTPATPKDLAPFVENSKAILDMIAPAPTGWVVFQWNSVPLTQMTDGTSNTILAYESQPDRTGQRLVLFADASVQELLESEFQQKPKAQQRSK